MKEGNTFDEIVNEVYDIINDMLDKGCDVGGIVNLMMPLSLDVDGAVVQGRFNSAVEPGEGMKQTFIAFCVALMQAGISPTKLREALLKSVVINKRSTSGPVS